jgi:nicotinate-nucleotide pyrophosphorylase (carboxylating)
MPDQPLHSPSPQSVSRIVRISLDEDGVQEDLTTDALVPKEQRAAAVIVAKEHGVLAGLPVAMAVFATLDASLKFEPLVHEGTALAPGKTVARISGALAPILTGERVALNFLQRLSGIATATRAAVDAVAGTGCLILDTRKTTPGLRELERYAVRIGGGHNHRFNLAGAVLIKDNHLAAARLRGQTISDVLAAARKRVTNRTRIEIEVTNVAEVREAIDAGAKALLLDNMAPDAIRQAVEIARRADSIELEASGGVTMDNIRSVAETGVDFISVGALTHSVRALDLSLEVELSG